MTAALPTSDQDADRMAGEKAFGVFIAVLAMSFVVDSSSIVTEWGRDGNDSAPLAAWILEGTSMAVQIALFPLVRRFERSFPVDSTVDVRLIGAHVLASIAYSLAHVVLMVALREVLWLAIFGGHYPGIGTVFSELFYEYRKDVMSYGLILFLLYIFRTREVARLEAAAARADAKATHRLTLKCGGRSIHLDAGAVEFAKAAGNYVEVTAGGRTHLARTTLRELERQLDDAGAEPVRVHRSWLVRRGAIAEVAPTGEGSVTIRMDSGAEVPGSRSYRAAIDAA
ncbi:MAG: LytTR family DNA-binding domain-containing protein [Pseudomonadota bacterium]